MEWNVVNIFISAILFPEKCLRRLLFSIIAYVNQDNMTMKWDRKHSLEAFKKNFQSSLLLSTNQTLQWKLPPHVPKSNKIFANFLQEEASIILFNQDKCRLTEKSYSIHLFNFKTIKKALKVSSLLGVD